MEYQVLARKWRPQCFADVVGQKHITQTLQSELLQDKTAHAYLFVGPRGIGKTSIARIFAKALNCKNGPTKEPCCKCESCIAIAEANSLDLIEIDGASNNSVDDIRQLREEVLYSPTSSRFKIYIIDEVHMLSNQAWNALLKTIEEPPSHAKFLFATTEAHKVLPTVVSRCQRFDLQRITFRLITEQMKKIATAEGVQISDAAIEVIARAADGGMRDAQSLLDQMIAFTSVDQSEISEEQALAIFGLTGVAEMEKLIRAIIGNDRPALIGSVHHLASQGKNLEKLFEDILAFIRGIQICLLMKEPGNILEIGDDLLELYRKIASDTDTMMIQKLLENLSPVGRMLHDALNKQVFLETILLKAMRIAHAVEIETLIHRLNQLRKGGELLDLEKIPSLTQTPQTQVPPQQSATPAPVVTPVASTPVQAPPPVMPPAAVPETPVVAPPQAPTPPPITTPPVAPVPPPVTSPINEVLKETDVSVSDLPETKEVDKNLTDSTPQEPTAEKKTKSVVEPEEKRPQPPSTEPEKTAKIAEITTNAPVPDKTEEKPAAPSASIGFDSLFATDTTVTSGITEKTANNVVDTPPEFPEPPSSALPEPEKPKNAFEAQALHVLEHPKETGPVKIDPVSSSSKDDKITPESLWHSAIEDMEHCQQPLLKAYMQQGVPQSFIDNTLTILFDEESAAMHITELQKEKKLIETCLRRISGNNQITFKINEKEGIVSPHDVSHLNSKDLAAVKERAENNPFVKDVIDLFGGTIVDVRG